MRPSRGRREEISLPAAVVDQALLRRIESRIPESLSSYTTWDIGFGKHSVSGPDLNAVLDEVRNESRFDTLIIEVLDPEDSNYALIVNCEKTNVWLDYSIPEEREAPFRSLTEDVQRAFNDKKRWSHRFPFRFRNLGGAQIRLGAVQPPFSDKLNWSRMAEDVAGRIFASVVLVLFGLVVGFVAGLFARPSITGG